MCLLVIAPSFTHADDVCESTVRFIPVGVEIYPGEVEYFNKYDRAYLAKKLSTSKTISKAGWVPSGMTSVGFGYSIHLSVQVRQMSSGLFCSELSEVEARVGYDSVGVYIASDYAPGSCQYDSVLEHEHVHVGIYQQSLVEYASLIEKELRKAIERQESVITDHSDIAVKILQARIEKPLKFLINKIDKTLKKRNAALDTIENYKKELGNCSSW
jgi:hypothetical protein